MSERFKAKTVIGRVNVERQFTSCNFNSDKVEVSSYNESKKNDPTMNFHNPL